MTTCDKFEDPTPTTLEWLVALGMEKNSVNNGAIIKPKMISTWDRLVIFFTGEARLVGFLDSHIDLPGTYETRGKVRRLFQAFSLELNEPEEIVSLGPLWAVKKDDGFLIGQLGDHNASFMTWKNRKPAEESAVANNATVIRIA